MFFVRTAILFHPNTFKCNNCYTRENLDAMEELCVCLIFCLRFLCGRFLDVI